MKTVKCIFLCFCIFAIFIKIHRTQEPPNNVEPFPKDLNEDENKDKIVFLMDKESLAGERCDPGDG